jgi:hypothetical protein
MVLGRALYLLRVDAWCLKRCQSSILEPQPHTQGQHHVLPVEIIDLSPNSINFGDNIYYQYFRMKLQMNLSRLKLAFGLL